MTTEKRVYIGSEFIGPLRSVEVITPASGSGRHRLASVDDVVAAAYREHAEVGFTVNAQEYDTHAGLFCPVAAEWIVESGQRGNEQAGTQGDRNGEQTAD